MSAVAKSDNSGAKSFGQPAAAPQSGARPPKRRRKRKKRRPMSIAAVCRAAAREGVSYGVYVYRHGV